MKRNVTLFVNKETKLVNAFSRSVELTESSTAITKQMNDKGFQNIELGEYPADEADAIKNNWITTHTTLGYKKATHKGNAIAI